MSEAPDKPKPPRGDPPSKIPSWITLGFMLGALFILALERHRTTADYAASSAAPDEAGAGPVIAAAPRVTSVSAPSTASTSSATAASAAGGQPGGGGAASLLASAPSLDTVEAIFAVWGQPAVWKDDLTEVALWNSTTHRFSDCFEVMRTGDTLYFRSIPHLTRPILTHGVPVESPLQFTETDESRAQWLSDVHSETWRAISESARSSLNPGASSAGTGTQPP